MFHMSELHAYRIHFHSNSGIKNLPVTTVDNRVYAVAMRTIFHLLLIYFTVVLSSLGAAKNR